jgi:hypothetical protein
MLDSLDTLIAFEVTATTPRAIARRVRWWR